MINLSLKLYCWNDIEALEGGGEYFNGFIFALANSLEEAIQSAEQQFLEENTSYPGSWTSEEIEQTINELKAKSPEIFESPTAIIFNGV